MSDMVICNEVVSSNLKPYEPKSHSIYFPEKWSDCRDDEKLQLMDFSNSELSVMTSQCVHNNKLKAIF